ncbi:bifunctional DNA-formamidopyrimidine glycosylase/DNA-(apurinic or apyrimidinic site) lyase [Curvibacter sp. APW13]|uniref:bifunctional DNA-formamidopyrimidine glycosylase/DNA-(apurinic or apyrimidinic site) lyase n=1 Tax=Curvibacter sp. APW13 TaxID=3077236 RepID=UPI0028DF3F74|nr:bifunctional DNA-formamidopyrimidine glycosylase/DNA-(apurinic or apyrimidinic site) lyase [Curvibacter sp. APW13]MDT8992461.1 bifunctional DNA-formamidopyrimidine glycosylase/DNA-(apurinic or apyrimidinic site) lyase [Curvibacter sp. APW13]
MPELPEVEVTRRGIDAALRGGLISSVRLGKPLRWPLGCDPQALLGRRITDVQRRGKYVLLLLDDGVLLLHLGMSGSVQCLPSLPPPGVHDHFDLHTSEGCLRLNDPRRFGAVVYAPSLDDERATKLLGRLGVEPLQAAFTPEHLHAGLKAHRTSIKQVLLEGEVVVGVGNIYASEALFLARIRPTMAACRISKPRSARLHAAIIAVLTQALNSGGSTLRNFSGTQGDVGRYQQLVRVYGREGQPCPQCGAPIRQIRQGQRSTFFCNFCQKP